MKYVLETEDIGLKKACQSDWRDMYYNIWRHAESAKYMLWNVTESEEAARSRMERTIAWQAEHPYLWIVYEKKSGRAIGFAGLEVLQKDVCGETGIAIGPDFTGRGYGTQILNELVRFAGEELGAKRFIANCRSENEVSRKLQVSCGFQYSHSEQRVDIRTQQPYVLEYYYKELG